MKVVKIASNKKWFQKGAFEDGWQFGDLLKTIVGTTADISENINAAVLDATENLIDTGAYGVGVIGGLFDKNFQDDIGGFIAQETLKPDKYGKTISDYTNPIGWVNTLFNGGDTEKNSVLGDKSDGLVQSAAHVVGSQALGAINPGLTKASMAVNAFGNEIEQAYQRDATHLEAGVSGTITAGVELLTEKISSGIKLFKGAKSLDDGIVTALSNKISNKLLKTLTKWGITTVFEAAEEPIADLGSAVGRKLTYLSEEEFNEIFTKEDAWDSFVGGLIISGGFGAGNIINSSYKSIDTTTQLAANNDNIVKKLYDNEIAKSKTNIKKLSFSDKNEIYNDIKTKFEQGEISDDIINDVLGSEKYKTYKNLINDAIRQENILKAGIGLIESIPQHQRTVAQNKTLAGAKEKLENYKNILRTQKLHQEGKENLNKNNEEKINHIDPDEVISGMWEDSPNNLKKNVEKSRFKSVEKTDESGIINYNEKAFDVNLLPKQVHHFITNKNLKYTPKFNKIVSNYGLHLNGSWNKMEMNHLGRHPNAYHKYILKHIYKIDKKAKGNTKKFISEFDKIKKEILDNPYMLRKDYWRDKENEIL